MHAQAIPSIPDHGTFRDWGGIVQIGLTDTSSELCAELNSLREKVLDSEHAQQRQELQTELLVQAVAEGAMAKLEKVVSNANKNQTKINRQLQEAFIKQVQINEELKCEKIKMEEEFKSRISSLEGEVIDLKGLTLSLTDDLKSLEFLANHVRRRRALEKTRLKIKEDLEKRDLKVGEKWMSYFDEFSDNDWSQLFTIEDHDLVHDVKHLLRKGPLDANFHIHAMDPADVLVGIMGNDVEYWECANSSEKSDRRGTVVCWVLTQLRGLLAQT